MPLIDRTALANTVGADLFVSIHANAAHNPQAEGIETFFYPYAEAKSMTGDRGALLNSYLSKKMEHSRGLASFIQLNLCSAINTFQDMRHTVVDRGVKTAPFQVLIERRSLLCLLKWDFFQIIVKVYCFHHWSFVTWLQKVLQMVSLRISIMVYNLFELVCVIL